MSINNTMPPVTPRRRLFQTPARRSSARRSAAPKFRKMYKRGTKIGASSRAKRGQQNVIKLTTLSKKQEMVSISYREQFDMNSMGYGAAASTNPLQTPFLLRTDLNNPCIGGPPPGSGAQPSRNINVIISKLQQDPPGTGISTDPAFTRSSYEDQSNLSSRLTEYFDEYRSAIVVSSEVTYSVRPKLNQVGRLGPQYPQVSLIPWYDNASNTEGDTALRVNEANLSGELLVWNVRQSGQGQLYDNNGVFSNIDLKTAVPGMRMTKLNVTPTSARGCTYTMKYSPKTQFQIKDWRDNKQALSMNNAATVPSGFKPAYSYLGIGISDKNGTRFGWKPCNCIVEVNVKYNIQFSERRNERGNNEPVPHRGEL